MDRSTPFGPRAGRVVRPRAGGSKARHPAGGRARGAATRPAARACARPASPPRRATSGSSRPMASTHQAGRIGSEKSRLAPARGRRDAAPSPYHAASIPAVARPASDRQQRQRPRPHRQADALHQAPAHQQQEQPGPEHRVGDVDLRLQEVVHQAEDADRVGSLVQPVPILSEPPDRGVGGGGPSAIRPRSATKPIVR